MRTTLVVIFLVRVEQMAEMLLAKDHDLIEAVPPDRSDQPLPLDRAQTFQVAHVFHPLHGRELAFLDQYLAWGEDRVCFRDDTGKLRYLPTDWTCLASPDPS